MVGGLAWLATAAFTAYLGLLQLGYAGTVVDDGSLQATGIWNLIAAALTLFFGARLLTGVDRGFLQTSVWWAVLTVGWNGYQIMNGATHEAFVGATVSALVAGVLSFVARSSAPVKPAPPGPDWLLPPPPSKAAADAPTTAYTPPNTTLGWNVPTQSDSVPTAAAVDADPATPSAKRGRLLARLVVLAIVGALVVAGVLFVPRLLPAGGEATADRTPAPTVFRQPTVPPTTSVPVPLSVTIGAPVDMTTEAGAPLGSATVLEVKAPKKIEGTAPGKGNRYLAAKVRYDADTPWTYFVDEWALRETGGTSYHQVGFGAPAPVLTDGDLSAGDKVEGWVAFELPTDVAGGLWLDYGPPGGPALFTVRLE